jgi:hypothetical protein
VEKSCNRQGPHPRDRAGYRAAKIDVLERPCKDAISRASLRKWVALLKVYIDESGVHADSPVVTVAAYMARPKQWAAFTREWVRAIKPAKVYHATDAQNLRGEFKGWTSQQVDALAERALPIIPKHTAVAIAAGINMRDFRTAFASKPDLMKLLGDPYGACLQWVLTILMQEKAVKGNREQIAFFHEQNNFIGEASSAYKHVIERWNIGARTGFAFGSKEKFVPLQAADIYAYEANKRLRDTSKPNRRSLDALVPDKRYAELRYLNNENMADFMQMLEAASEWN